MRSSLSFPWRLVWSMRVMLARNIDFIIHDSSCGTIRIWILQFQDDPHAVQIYYALGLTKSHHHVQKYWQQESAGQLTLVLVSVICVLYVIRPAWSSGAGRLSIIESMIHFVWIFRMLLSHIPSMICTYKHEVVLTTFTMLIMINIYWGNYLIILLMNPLILDDF